MTERNTVKATFTIERTYPAKPARVFKAFSDEASKARWFAGSDDALGKSYQLDFQVGGHEVNEGGPPGGPTYTYTAEFRDIVPETRIVATTEMLADDTRISVTLLSVEFQPVNDTTRLVVTEQGAYLDGQESPAQRKEGTRDLLDALAASLSAGSD